MVSCRYTKKKKSRNSEYCGFSDNGCLTHTSGLKGSILLAWWGRSCSERERACKEIALLQVLALQSCVVKGFSWVEGGVKGRLLPLN